MEAKSLVINVKEHLSVAFRDQFAILRKSHASALRIFRLQITSTSVEKVRKLVALIHYDFSLPTEMLSVTYAGRIHNGFQNIFFLFTHIFAGLLGSEKTCI